MKKGKWSVTRKWKSQKIMKGKSYDFFMTSKMVQLMAVLLFFFFIFICVVLCSIYFIVCIVKSEQKKAKTLQSFHVLQHLYLVCNFVVPSCVLNRCLQYMHKRQRNAICNMQQHQLNRNALKHINARRELELKSRARPLTYWSTCNHSLKWMCCFFWKYF